MKKRSMLMQAGLFGLLYLFYDRVLKSSASQRALDPAGVTSRWESEGGSVLPAQSGIADIKKASV